MKRLLLLFCAFTCIGSAFSQDLANPSPNLQTVPGGSYIIAMDNTWQANDDPLPSKRYFNLKAYGLIVHLLNNNIKVRRAIRSGKVKDGVDFTALTIMTTPTLETIESVRDFKAGPFIVMAGDAFNTDIDKLIDNYNNNVSGVSGIAQAKYKVKVYKTTAAVNNVDIRYDLSGFIPKACILNDGGNASIHQNFMVLAGIPAGNYTVATNNNLSVNCFTFASEPHNGNPSASVVTNIKNFLLAGGNFLAECEAVDSYEALGSFQTTNGIDVMNSNVTTVNYPNADIGYAQFEGVFGIKQGGSVQNWQPSAGSSLKNGTCYVATSSTGMPIGASVCKILPNGTVGGVVFYLGNHSFTSTTDYNDINGMRMYMNALLTPAFSQSMLKYTYSMNCGNKNLQVSANAGPTAAYPVTYKLYVDNGSQQGVIDAGDTYVGTATINNDGDWQTLALGSNFGFGITYLLSIQPSVSCFSNVTASPGNCNTAILPVIINAFTAVRTNASTVQLKWQTANEQQIKGFNIRRKNGDEQWQVISFVAANGVSSGYSYNDANSFQGESQYQIDEVVINGRSQSTDIRTVRNSGRFSIYPNPAEGGKINVMSPDNSLKQVTVYDMTGRKIKEITTGESLFTIDALRTGTYTIIIANIAGEILHHEQILVK